MTEEDVKPMSSVLKDASPSFSLFTTLRFTSPNLTKSQSQISKADVPLLDRHIERLKEAHAHFLLRDGDIWGSWPGDEIVWTTLRAALQRKEEQEKGDWRVSIRSRSRMPCSIVFQLMAKVRLLLHKGARIEVQVLPAPADAPPFSLMFPPASPFTPRALVLDPYITDLGDQSEVELDWRRHKTTHREIYDQATARGGPSHPEVLLHTCDRLLETATSNIALHLPGNKDESEWITPALNGDAVFLNGVVRRELLERGLIREGNVTVNDFERCRLEGRRIIGFNGLR